MAERPHVLSLHRFPVKSMSGEQRPHLDLDQRGVTGDRLWSVRTSTGKIGSGKNTRRFGAVPGLLELRAVESDGTVRVSFPDGVTIATDAPELPGHLSSHLGQPVTVTRETDVSHFDDGPVSLLGSASLAELVADRGDEVDAVRFRANIVIGTEEAFVEDSWIGRRIEIGTAVLRVTMASPRCVMVDMRTVDLPPQHGNLTALGRLHDACLGVIATVERPGRVTVGDRVTVVEA
jgi:uncharacterized protein YcbX